MSSKNVIPFSTPTTDSSTTQTMSSLEIAELTGKQHKNVMADIRTMCDQLEIHSAELSAQYKDSTGRTLPCFNLHRDLTDCLLTGYSAKARMAVIKRWRELEEHQQSRFQIPQTMSEALRLAADQQDTIEEQQLLIADQSPKAKFYDDWLKSDELTSFRELANIIQIPETKLKAFLILNDALYEQGKKTKPYKRNVDSGKVKVLPGGKFKFTPNGVDWVIRMWDAQKHDAVAGRFFIY